MLRVGSGHLLTCDESIAEHPCGCFESSLKGQMHPSLLNSVLYLYLRLQCFYLRLSVLSFAGAASGSLCSAEHFIEVVALALS